MQDRLERRVVGLVVLLKHARNDGADIGRAAEHARDALRRVVVPAGPDEKVETRLGAVHGAEIGEAVGPEIGRLIDPIALAEIGDLHHHRLAAKIENAEAIDEILRRAGDVALLGADIVVQHGKAIDRRHGSHAADQHGLRLDALERGITVEHVHQRPGPEIGEAADLAHEVGREPRARRRAARKTQNARVSVLHGRDRLRRRARNRIWRRCRHQPQSLQQLNLRHLALPSHLGAKRLAQVSRIWVPLLSPVLAQPSW